MNLFQYFLFGEFHLIHRDSSCTYGFYVGGLIRTLLDLDQKPDLWRSIHAVAFLSLFEEEYLQDILSIVSSPSTRSAAWIRTSSFTSGSSSGICLRAAGLSGQASSLCQRKAGPSIYLEFVSRASADCPLEASSTGFLLVSTCFH